jgi:O-antigen/teichoic acid export membrane protein
LSDRKQFVGDSFLLFTANGFIGVLNYLFVLAANHNLSPAAFGLFTSLVACITISTVLINCLQLHIIRRVGVLGDASAQYAKDLTRRIVRYSGFGALVALVTTPIASTLLGANWIEWLLTYAAICALLFASIANGVSAGLLRFGIQSTANLVGTAVKLAVGAALLILGFGVSGALAAYVVGLALLAVLTLTMLGGALSDFKVGTKTLELSMAQTGRIERIDATYIAAYLFLVGPFSVDQVLVQSIARPLSGDYGTVCVLGKAIFLAVGPILLVQVAHVGAAHKDPMKQQKVFVSGASVTVGLAALLAAGLWFFSGALVRIMFSPEYAHTASEIGPMAAGVTAYVAGQALGLYLLARGTKAPLLIVGTTFLIQAALFAIRHDSLRMLVTNQLLAYAAQFILIVIAALLSNRDATREPVATPEASR